MDKKRKTRSQSRKKRVQLDEDTTRTKKRVQLDEDTTRTTPSTGDSQTTTSTATVSTSRTETEPSSSSTENKLRSAIQASTSKEPDHDDASTSAGPSAPRSASPEPDCAICLSKLENKSFTDSCFHMFCFVCLVEWSKVKAECPLCKQSFKSIVHNVRSYDDYDQYHIPRPEYRPPPMNPMTMNDLMISSGTRFRYRTTVTADHRYAHLANQIQQELENRLLQRPSAYLPIPNWRRARPAANSDFRRSIYLQRLKLRSEQRSTRRRVRETSPSFYSENPAQTHRLVPWLNRELNALLQGHGEQIAFVLDLIIGLIKRHRIDSEEFYQHVFPFVGRHTRQFMQEFLAFARSAYHIAAYDRNISYEPNDEPNVDEGSDSDHQRANTDDGNDSDVVVISPPRSQVRSVPPIPTDAHDADRLHRHVIGGTFDDLMRSSAQEDLSTATFGHRSDMLAPPGASGWDSPTPGPSMHIDPIGYPRPFNPSMWTTTSRFSNDNDPWTMTSRFDNDNDPSSLVIDINKYQSVSFPPIVPSPPRVADAETAGPSQDTLSSDNSDVEILDIEKPWHERSPIQLSSAGESDYDVLITGTGHVTDNVVIKEQPKKKKHKKHSKDGDHSTDHHGHYYSKDRETGKRKRSTDSTTSRSSKKHRHQSPTRSNSRSRSQTKIVSSNAPPDYQHKKFSYKTHTHDSSSDERASRKRSDKDASSHSQRSSSQRSRSRSSSTDSVHRRVSIMSHSHNSMSRHSSIEIVQYRKKSSKHKKVKKHRKENDAVSHKHKLKHKSKKKKDKKDKSKSSDKHSHDKDQAPRLYALKTGARAKRKHDIFTSDSDTDSSFAADDSNYLDAVPPYKERKKKSKKSKREHMNSPNNHPNIAGISRNNETNNVNLLKSDKPKHSKRDSNGKVLNKHSSGDKQSMKKADMLTHTSNTPLHMGGPSVAVEEITAAQAAVLDDELASINQALSVNNYIGSLFSDNTDNTKQQNPTSISNIIPGDPNMMVNPNDVLNPRAFKKHPFGHKKSGKRSTDTTETVSAMTATIGNSLSNTGHFTNGITQSSALNMCKNEDGIQSSDITSCSDVDGDRQLPSFQTLVERSNHHVLLPSLFSSSDANTNFSQNSITSSRWNKGRNKDAVQHFESTIVDVENVSDKSEDTAQHFESHIVDVENVSDKSEPDSDIDVLGDDQHSNAQANSRLQLNAGTTITISNNMKTSCEEQDTIVDVEGESDSSSECVALKKKLSGRSDSQGDRSLVDSLPQFSMMSGTNNLVAKPLYEDSDSNEGVRTSADLTPDVVEDDYDSDIECVAVSAAPTTEISDGEIDVVTEADSDIECSFVEGHKTFEIAEDSDGEMTDAGIVNEDEMNDAGTVNEDEMTDVGTANEGEMTGVDTVNEGEMTDAGIVNEDEMNDAGTMNEGEMNDAGIANEGEMTDVGIVNEDEDNESVIANAEVNVPSDNQIVDEVAAEVNDNLNDNNNVTVQTPNQCRHVRDDSESSEISDDESLEHMSSPLSGTNNSKFAANDGGMSDITDMMSGSPLCTTSPETSEED